MAENSGVRWGIKASVAGEVFYDPGEFAQGFRKVPEGGGDREGSSATPVAYFEFTLRLLRSV